MLQTVKGFVDSVFMTERLKMAEEPRKSCLLVKRGNKNKKNDEAKVTD